MNANRKITAPHLPAELQRGSVSKIHERQKQRVQLMEAAFPGVKFSLVTSNPLGRQAAKKAGLPGVGLPRAIFVRPDYAYPPPTPAELETVRTAYNRWKYLSDYITYTTLAFASQITFRRLFEILHYLLIHPQLAVVTMTGDRLGKNTAVKINWRAGAEHD